MAKTPKWRKVVAEYRKIRNVTKVAKQFNINRSTVYTYLKRAETIK
jgi:predicted transcriptional regulator YheO